MNKRIEYVQRFYDIGTVKWISPFDFYADRLVENTTQKCFYKKGETYYGLPYSFHNKIKLEDFNISQLSEKNIIGTDCIFAIFDALEIKDKKLLSFHSLDLLCDTTYVEPLGNFIISQEKIKSSYSVYPFTLKEIYESFSNVKPSDVIVTYFNKNNVGFVGHVRIVTGYPKVIYNDKGEIDVIKSYIPLSECKSCFTDTNDLYNLGGGITDENLVVPAKFNPKLTDILSMRDLKGKHTNFIFNKLYSFNMLFNQYAKNFNVYCMPMRFKNV